MREIDVDHKNISVSVNRGESFSVTHHRSTVDVSHDTKRLNVDRTDKTVRLIHEDATVQVNHPDITVSLYNGGKRGVPGAGVPDGGNTGEVLTKTDGGTAWLASEGEDKNFTTTFSNQAEVLVTHNLNKYPAITVLDSANDVVVGEVEYINLNAIRLAFSSSFTGRVTCN